MSTCTGTDGVSVFITKVTALVVVQQFTRFIKVWPWKGCNKVAKIFIVKTVYSTKLSLLYRFLYFCANKQSSVTCFALLRNCTFDSANMHIVITLLSRFMQYWNNLQLHIQKGFKQLICSSHCKQQQEHVNWYILLWSLCCCSTVRSLIIFRVSSGSYTPKQ